MLEQVRQRILPIVAVLVVVVVLGYIFFSPEEDASTPLQPAGSSTGQQNADDKSGDAFVEDEVKPAFDLVRISRGGTGVIAGRMSPGAEVELFANGEKVSSVTANDSGEWIIILNEPLVAGSVELNLKGRPDGSTEVTEAEDVVVVSVPEREPDRFVEREANGVVAVLSPKSGEGASRVLQRPGGAAFSEVGDSLSIDTIDYGNGAAIMTGKALPRVEVRLYLDDVFVGTVKADDNGDWSHTMPDSLSAGEHIVRLDQTLTGGDVQLRIEQPFTTGEVLDPSTSASGVIVKPGNTLWQIARRLYGTGVRYTLIFRENSEQIKDPNLIYPGQVFKLPLNGQE